MRRVRYAKCERERDSHWTHLQLLAAESELVDAIERLSVDLPYSGHVTIILPVAGAVVLKWGNINDRRSMKRRGEDGGTMWIVRWR